MSDFTSRMRRKALRLRNSLVSSDPAQVVRLTQLLEAVPCAPAELDGWSLEVRELIRGLVLDRISAEDLALVLTGLISYRRTGITPARVQEALVRGHENTAGLFQDVLHKALFDAGKASSGIQSFLFGTIDEAFVSGIVGTLREVGYVTLPGLVDADLIDSIRAESLAYSYRLKGGNAQASGGVIDGIDPSSPPACVSAYASPECVAASRLLQQVAHDELFVEIASRHLGCRATPIDSTFWYTFPWPTPSSETAQLFHYDLDTLRWIKVFVYLTDVDASVGPHEYVAGSHLAKNMAPGLLVRNYSRIDDQEVDEHYPGKRKSLTGKAGTVIIGDTRCLHKGNAVERGHRLMFSPIYAPSKIGYVHG